MGRNVTPTITVVSVTTSKTLATLLGAALYETTNRVTLRPHATGIYMDNGTASAADDPLGTQAIEIIGGPNELATLQFFAAGATAMTVIQEG